MNEYIVKVIEYERDGEPCHLLLWEDEIIRCRDCKRHSESGLCKVWSMFGTVTTDDTDFCSRAEPKEVEG
jgi:hypothetical protein